ncbi:HNH endonuclease [Antribacter gilvus]|uniref:HNH endonuclease n=1 Tax=Antribacter gilvus TaxID=2304675 RepID=UPI000F77F4A4|nr:HNH endonuclease signature motif containing protein [Antribacter gilvus]
MVVLSATRVSDGARSGAGGPGTPLDGLDGLDGPDGLDALDGLGGGPGLAAALAALCGADTGGTDTGDADGGGADLRRLDDAGLLDVAAGWARLIGWATTRQAAVAGELGRRRGWSVPKAQAAVELGARLGVPTFEADKVMARGAGLAHHPQVAAALAGGRIDVVKVDLLLTAGSTMTVEQRVEAIAEVLPQAGERSRSWVRDQMRAHARRHLTPAQVARAERDRRAVYLDPVEGGTMAWLSALLPAADAAAVWDTLDTAGRTVKRAGKDRTLAQARADVLTGILTGRLILPTDTTDTTDPEATDPEATEAVETTKPAGSAPTSQPGLPIPGVPAPEPTEPEPEPVPGEGVRVTVLPVRPVIRVTVAASTLLGQDDEPGFLDGYGPIDADTAALLAAPGDSGTTCGTGGTWQRLVTDPVTGILTDHSTHTYVPGPVLRAAVLARDGSCQFLQCDRPGTTADLDHLQTFDHTLDPATLPPGTPGQTRAANLQLLCRRHHNAKTHHGWTAQREPTTGTTTWTAPTGHTYTRPATQHGPRTPGTATPGTIPATTGRKPATLRAHDRARLTGPPVNNRTGPQAPATSTADPGQPPF